MVGIRKDLEMVLTKGDIIVWSKKDLEEVLTKGA